MKSFCWVVTILACCVSGLILVSSITSSTGAPQEAAGAAIAAAVAIIPYVFTRAIEGLSTNNQEKHNEEIIRRLKPQSNSILTEEEEKARAYDALEAAKRK